MIHGLSKYSTGSASGGIDYFLSDSYYDHETRTTVERNPKPVTLEGNKDAMRVLCDSLDFAHKYTSGVLSFSAEETAMIKEKGIKDQILADFKEFAFAGVPEDCRNILMVEHGHVGRLEVHYMIPRVHLESGKYFNPFPPNYSGKKGHGNNQDFIKQNDSFIDFACEKYGLQNPRDPKFARAAEIPPFDPAKDIKRQVVEALDRMIMKGDIGSRDDMCAFLERRGAVITRKGADYFSFKFDDMTKAVRLKGVIYGEQSFREIKQRHTKRFDEFEVQRAGFESRYLETLIFRCKEVEGRHKLPQHIAERLKDNDRRSSAELQQAVTEIRDLRDNVNSFNPSAVSAARDFVFQNGLADPRVNIPSTSPASIGSTDVVSTGNPVLDELLRHFFSELRRIQQESLASSLKLFRGLAESGRQCAERYAKAIQDIFRVNVSAYSGQNFLEPGRPLPASLAEVRKELGERIEELRKEIRLAQQAEKVEERVQRRVRDPLAAFPPTSGGLPTGNSKTFAEAAAELAEESRKAGPALKRAQRKGEDAGLES